MKNTMKCLRSACSFALAMLVICGVAYPFMLTAIAQVLCNDKANGSLLEHNNEIVGSALVGQDFNDARFFKGRPSAYNYNTYTLQEQANGLYAGVASGSNNYAPSNPDLKQRIKNDIEIFLLENPDVEIKDIPVDFITASGSGLDPHISVEAAQIQMQGIEQVTGLSHEQLQDIIDENTTQKMFGIFGEVIVNYVECNIAIAEKINM